MLEFGSMYVCMHSCMFLHMHVCMYVCICVNILDEGGSWGGFSEIWRAYATDEVARIARCIKKSFGRKRLHVKGSMQVDRFGGLGRQLRCIAGCKKVVLASSKGTFAKNEACIAIKSELNMHFFVASSVK